MIYATRNFFLTSTQHVSILCIMEENIYENWHKYVFFNDYLFKKFLKQNQLTMEKFCVKYNFDINLLHCFFDNKFDKILISDLLKLSALTLIPAYELIYW